VVEIAETLQAELANLIGAELTTTRLHRQLDPIDERLDVAGTDLTLVSRAQQRGTKLRAIEALLLAVALADEHRLAVAPLIGGEAVPARRALAPAPGSPAILGAAGLQNGRRAAAARTIHLRRFY
jgi:hypothetical protein